MKLKILVLAALLLCVFPTLAQDSTNSVTFNGFRFSFDSALATNVNISQVPGDPVEGAGPGFSDAAKTQFILYQSGQIDDSLFDTGGVRLYRMTDLAQYDFLRAEVERLQTLLAERPDLSQFEPAINDPAVGGLPYVPILTHGQVLTARAQYVETPTVTGISYLAAVRADLGPFTNRDFFYTFQGVSADGAFYVTVTINLNTPLFPEALESFDPAEFQENWPTYLAESITTLNEAAPSEFSPSLDLVDALVESITFSGVVAPPTSPTAAATATVETTDPTMGGLAGVNWALVSYGSADASTPVLPEAPITATFSEQGITGSAGCNTYSGPFQFANGALTIGPLITTEIACADPINAQETAYLNALATANTFQIENRQLQITYDGGVLTFRDASLVATPLEGNWTLVWYGSADAPTPVLTEAPITLIVAGSQVSGSAGCNSYGGTVQVEGNTLTFGELVSTLIACEEPIQTQETTYLEALRTASTFQLADGQLQITYGSGVLTFSATA